MTKLLFGLLTVALLTNQGIAGQSKRESIQGVWQAVEVTIAGPGARTIAIPEPLSDEAFGARQIDTEPVQASLRKASTDRLSPINLASWAAKIVTNARTLPVCSPPAGSSMARTPTHPLAATKGTANAPFVRSLPSTTHVCSDRNALAVALSVSHLTAGNCASTFSE